MKGKFIIFGIIVLLIVIGIVIYYQTTSKLQIANLPYVEIEATVISLSLDESANYSEGEEIFSPPRDSATIRIDKITKIGGNDFDWASIGIEEGKEVSLDLKYTARPTKIITVIGDTEYIDGNITSHKIVPTTIRFEDNHFVFRINGNLESEKILPGLQEGSKIKARIWELSDFAIDEYELIY